MKVNWAKNPKKQSTKESQPTKESRRRKRAIDALAELYKAEKECKITRNKRKSTLKINAKDIIMFHLLVQNRVVIKNADGKIEELCLVEDIIGVLEIKSKEEKKE